MDVWSVYRKSGFMHNCSAAFGSGKSGIKLNFHVQKGRSSSSGSRLVASNIPDSVDAEDSISVFVMPYGKPPAVYPAMNANPPIIFFDKHELLLFLRFAFPFPRMGTCRQHSRLTSRIDRNAQHPQLSNRAEGIDSKVLSIASRHVLTWVRRHPRLRRAQTSRTV